MVWTGVARADDALVVLYQPRTVRGEPAGLYARLHWSGGPGDRIQLPQPRLAQSMQPMFDGRLIALLTQGADPTYNARAASVTARQELVLIRTAPFGRVLTPWLPEWEPMAVLAEPSPIHGECRLIVLERRIGARTPPRGQVRVLAVRLDDDGNPRFALHQEWDLHGAPVAGAADWKTHQLYVACEGPRLDTGALVAFHLQSGELRYAPMQPPRDDVMGAMPVGLAIVAGGSRLALLESAYALDRRDGGRVSTLRLIDATALREVGDPVSIPGAAPRATPAFVTQPGGAILSTVDVAAGFAYATALDMDDQHARKRDEWSFRDVALGPRMSASPDGTQLAVAAGKSILVVSRDQTSRATFLTEDTTEAIVWNREGIYAADGAHLVRLDPNASPAPQILERFDGFIVDALTVPAAVPAHLAAPLPLPARVMLEADTPGLRRRVIRLPVDTRVRLAYDERAAAWLNAAIVEVAPGNPQIDLTLNLQHMQRPGEYRARVFVQRADEISQNADRPTGDAIEVVGTSFAKGTRAVEWQSTAGFASLMQVVAGAPLHLSQRTRRGPIAQAPRGSAVVVVRLEDVARGAITRQVLLDYVTGGGGLLVVAAHAPENTGDGLRRWLEPLGMMIDPAQEVSGTFAIPAAPPAALGLDQLTVAAGAYIETTRPMEFIVPGPGPNTAALVLTQHGYGRLAVIAGGSPLEDAALAQGANRRFARALFGWLAGGQRQVRDSDNDGLRDAVEDSDGDGQYGTRETDFLNPDTDGDGLPDGAEDINLNGLVDEGETEPRRADTDGDGIPDGADIDPLPPAGTPAIVAMQPQEGPAEGGTLVELTGRNLPVNPQVWFGERRASAVFRTDSTRVIAAPPPRIFGELTGPVNVRVADPLDVNEYVFKEAYTYRPPSSITLALTPIARIQRAYDGYRGSVSFSLDVPDLRIDSLSFLLRIDPALPELDGELVSDSELAQAGRTFQVARYGAGKFHFQLSPGEPLTGRVDLGTFSWRLAEAPPDAGSLRWYVLYPDARVLWGGNVDVAVNEVDARLNALEAQAVPARPPDPAAFL